MEKILEILQEIRPDSDFVESSGFVDDYLLDSFDIISLISQIEKTYDIQISNDDIVPKNFQSVESIAGLIRKYGGVSS